MDFIKLSPPDISDLEIEYVTEALKSGWITTGPKTKLFEKYIAEYCNTSKAVCLNSATACMEMTLRLLGIGEGDEVITQRTAERVEPVVARHVDQPRHDSDRVADHQQQAVVAHAVGVHQPVQILEPQRHLPWKASKLTHQA